MGGSVIQFAALEKAISGNIGSSDERRQRGNKFTLTRILR